MTLTDEEIRVKIAELMGCKRYLRPHDGKVFLCLEKPAHWKVVQLPVDKINSDVPDYLNDERAALRLCDRMHSEGWGHQHYKLSKDDEWTVKFWLPLKSEFTASDPSLARAVTLAFLKAHE